MELVDRIKRNDENIKKYINRISVKESMFAMKLSKEDYYTEVIYIFYENMIDGFMDYSSETIDILKEAIEYLKEFIDKNRNNKDIDIRKYSDAIWNGEEIISHVVIH